MKRVLFLDDLRDPQPESTATRAYTVVRTVADAIKAVRAEPTFDRWELDHDLGLEVLGYHGRVALADVKDADSGYDFLKYVVEHLMDKWPDDIVVHSANPPGRANMETFVRNVNAVLRGIPKE